MLVHQDHDSIVTAIAFSPDGSLLVTGAKDGSIIRRDSFGDAIPLPGAYSFPVLNLAFLSSESLFIVRAQSYEVWDLVHGENAFAWPDAIRGQRPELTAGTALSDSLLLLGARDAGLWLFDLKTRQPVPPKLETVTSVRAVATCPAHKTVAWSTPVREVKVQDIRKQSPLMIRTSHVASALALAPDGSAVAAVQDWAVRIHDLISKQDRPPLKGHKGVISCLAFSPDGSTLATGSWDGTVRFWDPRTGSERAVFQWPVGKVFSLAFSPDGQRAAAGGDGGAVVVWDVE